MNQKTIDARQLRAYNANSIIIQISERGHRYFNHDDAVSHFEIAENGRVMWRDEGKRCLTTRKFLLSFHGHFSEGGTLQALVEALWDHIVTGRRIGAHLGAWNTDPWGYGTTAMQEIRAAAELLSIIVPQQFPPRTMMRTTHLVPYHDGDRQLLLPIGTQIQILDTAFYEGGWHYWCNCGGVNLWLDGCHLQ
jgi:hypothetical protein